MEFMHSLSGVLSGYITLQASVPTRATFQRRLDDASHYLKELKVSSRDEKIPIDILEECVQPRLQRLKADFANAVRLRSRLSLPGRDAKWLHAGRYVDRLAHIELMLHLTKHRSELTPYDWVKIANWQLATYREACHRLQLSYFKATKSCASLPAVQSVRTVLKATVTAAYAQHDFIDYADIYDVFTVRNVFDHTELRGLLKSDLMDSTSKAEMAKIEAGVTAQQPAFPQWSYQQYLGHRPAGSR